MEQTKSGGKPESMLNFIAQNEIGSDKAKRSDEPPTKKKPGRPAKGGRTPSSASQPKALEEAQPVTAAPASSLTHYSQLEAISDSESPENITQDLSKGRRGRPPKSKGEYHRHT